MPSEIHRNPEGGGVIIHVLKRPPKHPTCAYCPRPGTQLCDYRLPGGATCDRPTCLLHCHHDAKTGTDICESHWMDAPVPAPK